MAKKIVMMKISELKRTIFVRRCINQNHMFHLALLIEAGVDVGAIKVTPEGEIIDGRHRTDAYEYLGQAEIPCEVIRVGNEIDIISEAFGANCGGALPPTRADVEHTVQLLLDRNASTKKIAAIIRMPISLAKKFVGDVNRRIERQKVSEACDLVTNGGLTVPKAAEAGGVTVEQLKNQLGPRKRRTSGVAELKSEISRSYRSMAQKNASIMRNLLGQYDEGDLSEGAVREVLAKISSLKKRAGQTDADWERRLEAMITSRKNESAGS